MSVVAKCVVQLETVKIIFQNLGSLSVYLYVLVSSKLGFWVEIKMNLAVVSEVFMVFLSPNSKLDIDYAQCKCINCIVK
jgi:hypothetical protein